jgi:Family of unknown function (DUF6516)
LGVPFHVRSLEDYSLWLEKLVDQAGGYLEHGPYLEIELILDIFEEAIGLRIREARLRFHDGTVLVLRLVIDGDLNPVEYNFHFQDEDGRMTWRKDKHEGHEADMDGREEHIHNRPDDPVHREPFDEVHIDEALEQIAAHQSRGG